MFYFLYKIVSYRLSSPLISINDFTRSSIGQMADFWIVNGIRPLPSQHLGNCATLYSSTRWHVGRFARIRPVMPVLHPSTGCGLVPGFLNHDPATQSSDQMLDSWCCCSYPIRDQLCSALIPKIRRLASSFSILLHLNQVVRNALRCSTPIIKQQR